MVSNLKGYRAIKFDIVLGLIELKCTVGHWQRYALYLVPFSLSYVIITLLSDSLQFSLLLVHTNQFSAKLDLKKQCF